MKKRNIVIISVLAIAIIIISLLTFLYFSSNTLSKQIPQSNDVNSKALIIADTSSGTAPLKVYFKSFLQNFNDEVQYAWDFGDGEFSDDPNPIHFYHTGGSYNCTLKVKDNVRDASDKIIITVRENNPPIVKIVVDKTSGNRPLIVHFDVDGFDTDGEIISYDWEIQYPPFFSYQKVTSHNEKNFSEKFLRSGFYEVKLKVTDDTGGVTTDYIKIQVLGHKIELLARTTLYYIGIFDTVINLGKNLFDKFTVSAPQTFFEKIASMFEVN
jgi:PKD repeat protein